jgi:hypothetical protein
MLPNQSALGAYRRMLLKTGQCVIFRRVTGQAPDAVTTDVSVTAVFRHYQPSVPIGAAEGAAAISEGDREFIVLVCDLEDAGFPLPLQKNDKIILGGVSDGETYNIEDVDYGSRIFAGAIQGMARGV